MQRVLGLILLLGLGIGAARAEEPGCARIRSTDMGWTDIALTTNTAAILLAAIRPRGRIVAAAMVAVPVPVPVQQDWLTATSVTITGTSVGTRLEMAALMRLHAAEPSAPRSRRSGWSVVLSPAGRSSSLNERSGNERNEDVQGKAGQGRYPCRLRGPSGLRHAGRGRDRCLMRPPNGAMGPGLRRGERILLKSQI
jgi:hypothetical protein